MGMNDVALMGPAGVGKDSVARVLVEKHGYVRLAFADAMKDVLLATNPLVGRHRLSEVVGSVGWDEAKQYAEVRRLLQVFGMAMRVKDEKVWINALSRSTLDFGPFTNFVITDVRLPNEFDFARYELNALMVRLDRPGVRSSEAFRSHVSETALDGEEVDLTVEGDWSPEDAALRIMDAFASERLARA